MEQGYDLDARVVIDSVLQEWWNRISQPSNLKIFGSSAQLLCFWVPVAATVITVVRGTTFLQGVLESIGCVQPEYSWGRMDSEMEGWVKTEGWEVVGSEFLEG